MIAPAKHIYFIDRLRGLAIFLVYIFHALRESFHMVRVSWDGWARDLNLGWSTLVIFPASMGSAGVAVFFAISGFCIHLSHERSRLKGYKVFFVRRFFRIYPPYFVVLCILTVVYALTYASSDGHHLVRDVSAQFLTHLILIHNYWEYFFFGISGPFWSIAVEVQLYLLYPLLMWIVRRWGWRTALYLTGAIELGCRAVQCAAAVRGGFYFDVPYFFIGSPFGSWLSWTVGAALADAYLKNKLPFFRRIPLLLFPLLFLISNLVNPLYPLGFLLASLATVRLMDFCLGRIHTGADAADEGNPILRHLRQAGLVSYSAYLIHEPLLKIFTHGVTFLLHHRHIPGVGMFALCLVFWFPVLGVAYLFYRLLELPSIAFGARMIERMAARRAAAQAPM